MNIHDTITVAKSEVGLPPAPATESSQSPEASTAVYDETNTLGQVPTAGQVLEVRLPGHPRPWWYGATN